MLAGRSPTIHGDGQQSRDFTFVADAVQANLLAAAAPGVGGRLYNVACGRRTSLLRLVEILNERLGTTIRPIHTEPRAGDVQHSLADIAAAQQDFGYRPSTSLEQGLADCVDFFRHAAPPECIRKLADTWNDKA
jgi:nucleoside-diphosphate-sugar epimerase